MYSHTTIGSNDLARARAFYDAVLAPLGLEVRYSDPMLLGYGEPGGRPQFIVARPFDGREASPGNGAMVALLAPKRSAVDSCHAAAMMRGGADEGAPGLRPHYHRNYYGAYFRDLDGNKICVVSHHPE
ncbi:VOC family protein [Microvirga subterranea]|uniref:Catechol 2,3-dioxygenase-like lactoylglutathione lyase family enzyme n=1 Tax=Microvirga subterranea TaxID=186651 RepID=A0A370HR08_9HYPH|nr:VOC family protein [Microvirga subterranea]RDI60983.1 catechol 2,3-dioxygenase-like lactoylglutathione lyase family enzyme [Microvirga subterranea]